jgi:beta-galactosidase/beta-glucuronidase
MKTKQKPALSKAHPPAHVAASHGYPRPQFQRAQWINLNGAWEFAIDADGVWRGPDDFAKQTTIQVPFSPETPLSGVQNTGFYDAIWYRRQFKKPSLQNGQRLIIHFGAVDFSAKVWVNDRLVAKHEGGYTPFSADITDELTEDEQQTIVVRAFDDPQDLAKPRGKQDWRLEPHSIWYPRTSGIWQTVWLEVLPASWLGQIRWTPILERWEIGFEVWLHGKRRDDLTVSVRLSIGDRLLAEDHYKVVAGEVHRRIAMSDPGIDDYRNDLLWYPWSPRLIDAVVQLRDGTGAVIDEVKSYTAMRSVALQGDRFLLNNRPLQLQLVLDQGYWQDGGLTAPSDDALRRDVELAKEMGFNGVRKHQKIEDPRYLYWADKLGLLVWEEMPSPYRFTTQSIRRLTEEWQAAMERDISHPCIVAWVPFNESWGVPDLPDSPAQRNWVRAMYHLTKTLDPTRPCIGNDGWESVATDIISIHDYDASPERIAKRYGGGTSTIPDLLKYERPGHRTLLLSEFNYQGQPLMLTEFGGIAYARDKQATWGYSRADSADVFGARYAALMEAVRSLGVLSGFCYTQFTDTYQEANGLLYMDRTPKFPLAEMSIATRGAHSDQDREVEAAWRKRLMQQQKRGANNHE